MANLQGTELYDVFHKIVDIAVKYMEQNENVDEPIVRFRTPEQLRAEIDLPIGVEGISLKDIIPELEKVMKYSVRTGHIRFFNQLWAGTDKAAVIGEWLTTLMNTSMYTYEVSPVFSLMEIDILDKVRKLIGWQDGDGVFAPGGANCNLLAILAARNHMFPHIKKEGFRPEDKLVGFTSLESHYTIQRGGSVIGVGMDGILKVPVDAQGRMDPAKLDEAIQKAIQEGKKPFFVNATCGTTVLGAYDNISAIADVTEKYKIWLHVDAAWGGHCLLSKKWRHLMNGVHRADSVTWTATKCLGLPQQCSVVVMRSNDLLYKCNAMKEDYLFHEHEQKEYDLGEKTLNCGRRVDAFKLWLSWKVHGDKGFEEIVDHAFDQAAYMVEQIKKSNGKFVLLTEPASLNVCFWYVPPTARNLPDGPERDKKLDDGCVVVRRRMQLEGKVLVNYSDLPGEKSHFYRMITCNPGASRADIDFVLSEIDRLGQDL
jgi:glutamate/tyrosine decarboxylase-like PLP-dependent enzyme